MVVHGSRLPHLLVGRTFDPFPYNNNAWFKPSTIDSDGKDDYTQGYTVEEISNSIKGKSGSWAENDCDHNVSCG
jgi:hypothetical protein